LKKILITGGSGLLAVNWALYLREKFKITLLLHSRKIVMDEVNCFFEDLSSYHNCVKVLEKYEPDYVINTAAITSIEVCEKNENLAYEINVDLAINLAKACNNLSIKLIHISTDHLFSGIKKVYKEIDKAEPLNIYALTKQIAEQGVLDSSDTAIVIRTNFYGWGPSYRLSFSDYIIEALKKDKIIHLFKDVFFTPVYVDCLFDFVDELIFRDFKGIYNISSNEVISKYDFGILISKEFGFNPDLIIPISIDEKTNLIKRPKNMSLDNEKISIKTGKVMPKIDLQLNQLAESKNKLLLEKL